jgi:hypothetical protein
MNWQPIETAPKDRYIITYVPRTVYSVIQIYIARWSETYKEFTVFGTYRERPDEYSEPNIMIVQNPTHWMPLPEEPLG